MKKKLLAALLSVGALLGLASCVEEHVHAFSEDWSKDANGHWHACTCDERLKDSFAPHVDENNDGACDVCAQTVEKKHEHTFATTWSKDETGHWYDSTCDHKVTSGFAAHTAGEDGVCTACGYVVTPPSNVATLKAVDAVVDKVKTYYNVGETFSAEGLVVYETYSNTLSDDTLVVGDVSKYTISVKDSSGNAVTGAFAAFGNYTVTVAQGEISDSFEVRVGAKAYDSVEAALNVGIKNADKVNSGSVIVNTEFEYSILDYYFGDNYFGYVSNDLTSDYDYEYHFEKLSDESIFGIQVSNYFDSDMWETIKTVSSYYEPTTDNMLGVDLKSFFSYNYEVYGIEALIDALYTDATAETSQNYKESFSNYCDACGVHHGYKFSFGAYIGYYFYEVEVEFVLDADSESIKSVEIVAGQFYDESVVLDEETGKYSYAEGVTGPDAVKSLTISQNVGDRNYESEYPVEDYLYSSFDLTNDKDEKVTAETTINAVVGSSITLNVVDALPVSADSSVDEIKVKAYDAEGNESDSVFGGYDDGSIIVTAYNVGNYVIEVKSVNVTKTFKLTVDYGDLESFVPAVYDDDYVKMDSIDVYPNTEVDLKAVVNEGANPAYEAALGSDYENATLEAGYDNNYIFKASELGTYAIILTSSADSSVTATLTVNVIATPTVAEILNGTYEFRNMMMGTVTYVFTPESEGATSGVVAITSTGGYAGDSAGTFNYSYEDGVLTCTPTNAGSTLCKFTAGLNSNYQVECLYNEYPQGVCTKVEAKEDDENQSPIIGTHNTVVVNQMTTFEEPYSITFNDDGTGSFNFNSYRYFGTFTYTFVENILTFSDVIDESGADITLSAVASVDKLSVTYVRTFEDSEDEETATIDFTVEGLCASTDEEPKLGDVEVEASYWGVEYTYTADKTGTYTFSVDPEVGKIGYNYETHTTLSLYLEADASVVLTMLALSNDVTSLVLNVAVVEGARNEEKVTVDASYQGIPYTYTAEEAGSYTFIVSDVDAIFDLGDWTFLPEVTVELEAGEAYTVNVCDNNDDSKAVITIVKA